MRNTISFVLSPYEDFLAFYHPQMKLGQGNLFTTVCQSFRSQGEYHPKHGAILSIGFLSLAGVPSLAGGVVLSSTPSRMTEDGIPQVSRGWHPQNSRRWQPHPSPTKGVVEDGTLLRCLRMVLPRMTEDGTSLLTFNKRTVCILLKCFLSFSSTKTWENDSLDQFSNI